MTGNSFGRIFRVTTSGESYGGAFRKDEKVPEELWGGLITIVDGVPPGLRITPEIVQGELDKRRPGLSRLSTPRKERDRVYLFSGIMEDYYTTGAPVGMLIPNSDISDEHLEEHRSKKDFVRPGQAAFTYAKKYGAYADWAGAGRASGRETASRVAAGAVGKVILDKLNIDVIAYVAESGGIRCHDLTYGQAKAGYGKHEINCPDYETSQRMARELVKLKKEGDSCGGVIEIIAKGVPAGLGEPVFDKLDATISHGLMSIGAVKGIEFGDGFRHGEYKGSQANDIPYFDPDTGKVRFRTNRAGGILGGISNGEEIRIRVAVKPTPTIFREQETIDMEKRENITHMFTSRSDPTILTRIYPVCEAMVRICLVDALFMRDAVKLTSLGIRGKWEDI